MASICYFVSLVAFISVFTGLKVNCNESSVSVSLGYIWTKPRQQNLQATRVVLTDDERDLKLICSIHPPLPRGIYNDINRDMLVQFIKVAPEYHLLKGERYWPDAQTRTAITINGTAMNQLGSYACSYRGVWSFIDIVADEIIANKLPSPSNIGDVEKFVVYRLDKSSVEGWSASPPSLDSLEMLFPCSVAQSKAKPSSVNKLLPSQVNVVAAMGDSLTTGVGAKATGVTDYFTQDRGLSWSIGGDKILEEETTLPNILKKFNKDLKGYSRGVGRNYSLNTELNVARSGSCSRDLPGQAQILSDKMKSSPNVDYNSDWKVVTIFSGAEDLCRVCHDEDEYSPSKYVESVIQTLHELQKIPRVLVNLVLPFDVSVLNKLRTQEYDCKVMNVDVCPCSNAKNANLTFVSEMHKKYIKLLTDFISSGMFGRKDDFTVVLQPFFMNVNINESLDRSLFSFDCYHFSTKGHSLAAAALWNNMVENLDEKMTVWKREPTLKCPSKGQPYLITNNNSGKHDAQSNFRENENADGVHPGVVVVLSLFLGAIFILIIGLIIRSRKSRPRNESLLSLVNNPHRAKPM